MKQFKTKRRSAGFTLIEMSVVVGLVAVAITAVTTRWFLVRDSLKAKTEVANISAMTGKIRDVFVGVGTYEKLSNTLLTPMPKVIPQSMLVDDGNGVFSIVNAWGGAVSIKPSSDWLKMEISYSKVTSGGCVSLVNGSYSMADSISIGPDVLKDFGSGLVSAATIAEKCSQAPTTPLVLVFA
jgi:prepilin-type N-terminal cleavage/methylation domain-containing protein